MSLQIACQENVTCIEKTRRAAELWLRPTEYTTAAAAAATTTTTTIRSLFSQASWGRLEMKPERNKFKIQAH